MATSEAKHAHPQHQPQLPAADDVRPQPYEVWSVAIGMPGAIFASLATGACAMAVTHGWGAEGWTGIVVIWVSFVGAMGVAFLGMADE